MEASALFAQLGLTVVLGFACRKALEGLGGSARVAIEVRGALNKVVLWVTMPALVFQTVHAAPLGMDIVQAPAAAIAGMAGTAVVAWLLLARRYGTTPETGGLVLAASAGSVSFFGIPIVRALFGAEEARVAVYFAVLNVPLALAAGAILSARIDKQRSAEARIGHGRFHRAAFSYLKIAGRQLIGTPATWALAAGVALQGVELAGVVDGGLTLLVRSVAPTTMFALGLGLRFERSLAPYRMALPAVAIKLAVSPIVVFACAWALGLSGLPLAIVALQGAMPTQVLSVVVAERFHLDSRLVGLTLAMDTALSFVLLPVVIGIVVATAGLV
ncbi:MAG: AEC family transporter [Chloroflexota bacterium]